jgi:hypothetical protein
MSLQSLVFTASNTYNINSENSLPGSYRGWFEIKSNGEVTRVIQYDNWNKFNQEIQEVWFGQMLQEGKVNFITSIASFIYKTDQEAQTPEAAFAETVIELLLGRENNFTNADQSTSREFIEEQQVPISPEFEVQKQIYLRTRELKTEFIYA